MYFLLELVGWGENNRGYGVCFWRTSVCRLAEWSLMLDISCIFHLVYIIVWFGGLGVLG